MTSLQDFVAQYPYERGPILDFMRRAAAEIPAGANVLDVGAGEAPYRELFAHTHYETVDYAGSVHDAKHTFTCNIYTMDMGGIWQGVYDAVICTQVLEHLAKPLSALRQIWQVLRKGGVLYMTVPLAWEIHEEPHDYYRYTKYGLTHLLRPAGFEEWDIQPRGNTAETLAQLLLISGVFSRTQFSSTPGFVSAIAKMDLGDKLPLGYTVRAVK